MIEVLAEDVDGIRCLILNRPDKLNSLNLAVFRALLTVIETMESGAGQVRCVVLMSGALLLGGTLSHRFGCRRSASLFQFPVACHRATGESAGPGGGGSAWPSLYGCAGTCTGGGHHPSIRWAIPKPIGAAWANPIPVLMGGRLAGPAAACGVDRARSTTSCISVAPARISTGGGRGTVGGGHSTTCCRISCSPPTRTRQRPRLQWLCRHPCYRSRR
jgi:hypothetical protein